ncbi:hypothetical protein GCM10010522_31910 [Kribbella solani]
MLSIHRLTAGDGYKYLLRHIASGDVDRRMVTPLTAYYTASGYPPGRWIGSGLAGLGDGGLETGSEVTEDQMAALFGRAEDPVTGRSLGRPHAVYKSPSELVRERIADLDPALTVAEREAAIGRIRHEEMRRKSRQAVAGFDLTFSPAKSVSALWATSDVGVQEQIVAAHHDAVRDVVALIESQAAFTRTGSGGVAQIDTRGLIGAAFDHWDTRSGDPQLHTHVVVANRVQGPDGAWRTLDGRVLYRAAVAMSEVHNVFLADNLSRRLGINWELRERGSQRNPAFEISGIPDKLIAEFSARTEQIEANLSTLLDGREGSIHPPSRREIYTLRQQATLMNRPPKHAANPLADLMAHWQKRAELAIGRDALASIESTLQQASGCHLGAADLSPETIEAYGAATVLTLQSKRATWTRWNLLAEAARQTRLLRLSSAAERTTVLERIIQSAEQYSINLTAPELIPTPATRADGDSAFTVHNGQIYTSPVILGAESILLELAHDSTGPTIDHDAIRTVDLGPDKIQALHRIATSGQKVEALIGPAGTGKTRLLAALTANWTAANGDGSIIALAPSSAASTVLADAIGVPTENIAKWIHESLGLGAEQRNEQIRHTAHAAHHANQTRRRRRHQRLAIHLAALHTDRDRWQFRKNQLVIIDEASMAGTIDLAALARAADTAGAKLLLVGDDAQLSAADTGGAFRLIAHATQAAELTDVWRFTTTWERDASLALRHGDPSSIDVYDHHHRLTAGSTDAMEDAAYKAWLADTNSGQTSLLIAADNATVARLNARAQLDRITTGHVEPGGVELHTGSHAGLGDQIVTRLNNRRIPYGTSNYVKNGDHWTVIHRWPDGSLTVQNDAGQTVSLPSSYVRTSVELAYATTAHRAQGTTVDTAHLVVTDQLTRALMYVGMTRGQHTNHAYIATHHAASDLHEPHPEQTMQDLLEAILHNPGIEQAAHEVLRQQLDNATRLDRLVPIHEHLCQQDARTRYHEAATRSGLNASDQTALEASPAYGALVAELRRAESINLNPAQLLHQSINQSPLHNAVDLAAVLHTRVERLVTRTIHRTGSQPPLIAGLVTPAHDVSDPTLITQLRELEIQIGYRADQLARKAADEGVAWHQMLTSHVRLPTEVELALTREIAAYRELYGVHAPAPLGAPPPEQAIVQSKQYSRLVAQLATISTTPSERRSANTTHTAPAEGAASNPIDEGCVP